MGDDVCIESAVHILLIYVYVHTLYGFEYVMYRMCVYYELFVYMSIA